MEYHYNRKQMAQVLKEVGLKQGDVVFSHSNIGYFGFPKEGRKPEVIFDTILSAFFDVIGDSGTLVVPTFTYSYTKREPYDPDNTPSTCGFFTEMLRSHPDAYRSHDPILSVAAIGARAEELTQNVGAECFGDDSFWARLHKADGVICNLNFDSCSTFMHYVERCLNVPYRYNKLFTGMLIREGQAVKKPAIYFCQDASNPDTEIAFEPFDTLARESGMVRQTQVGRGSVVCITVQDVYDLICEGLEANPWLLTASAHTGNAPDLMRADNKRNLKVSLPKQASMQQMIEALWKLPRDIISDGYDAALMALAEQVPMTIHEYPTGTNCWSWIIPEKWICHEAYLETLDGKRLFSYADHPLHVLSYSLPFEGEVPREELIDHLHVHPELPDALPFRFKYYERDWGLCCSKRLKDSLTDDRYRVRIDTSYSYSTLKVGEVVVPGNSDESVVLCAHLDHPALVNDDLAGVVVGMDVVRALLERQNLKYTYRFLILPETLGSIAYLSHNEDLIPKMKGGLFLEMLGLRNPHALQLSFDGNTELDRCFSLVMKARDPHSWQDSFPNVIGNDERQFNSPGVRVPMLSLSRVLKRSDPDWPFREYHSSLDNLDLMSVKCLEDSRDLVLEMIDALEANCYPINRFKGEVFCSRFGVHIDPLINPEGEKALFDIMYQIDGTQSIVEIAQNCNVSFRVAQKTIDILHQHRLIEYLDEPVTRNTVLH